MGISLIRAQSYQLIKLFGQNRIPQLDGIRGLAVLFVFMSHTSGRGQYLHEHLNFKGIGHIGVYLFFVLSGFLLSYAMFKKGLSKEELKKFYIKRLLRIIPLYYLVCLGVYFHQLYIGEVDTQYLYLQGGSSGLFKHFAFLQADGIFWSILIEIHFYLIVPILIFILIRYQRKGLIILSLLGLVNAALYIFAHAGPYDITDNFISNISFHYKNSTFIDVFLCGVIAAYVLHYYPDWCNKYRKVLGKYSSMAFASLCIMTLCLVTGNFLGFSMLFYEFRFFSIIYGFVFALFLLSSYLGNPFNGFFSQKWLRSIGIIGYSFYLLHFVVIKWVNTLNLHNICSFILSFILIYLTSYLAYRIIELPSIDLSRYLVNKLKK